MNKEWSELNKTLQTQIKKRETYEAGTNTLFDLRNQLMQVLQSQGVEVIKTEGEEFDPNFHQAVMTVKDDNFKSNMIVEELQRGYKLKDRVIRASLVKVSE